MKLYISPGACSLASHIAIRELGLPAAIVKVDLRSKRTADGEDFLAINSKGYVPALQLDDGSVLTECAAVLQYLADRKPELGLAPANGTMARYRLQEWLAFLNSEIHKTFGLFFTPGVSDGDKKLAGERLARRLDWMEQALGDRPYLLGESYSVADAYAYTTLSWAPYVGIDLARWPRLQALQARVGARPAVQAAHAAEQA